MSFLNRVFQPDVEKMEAKGDVEGLIKALEYKKSNGVRCYAAMALGRMREARAVQPIIAAFKANDPNDLVDRLMFASAAESALADIGAPAVMPLLATLKDSDQGVRAFAEVALAKIGEPAVEPLIAALGDESVGESAGMALAKMGTSAIQPLIGALRASQENVRAYSAMALGEIKDLRAVEPLIGALGDNDEAVRSFAAQSLGMLKDARAVEPLITALGDDSADVRKSVAWALAQFDDVRAVESLRAARQDSDGDVRKFAARLSVYSREQPAKTGTDVSEICDRCLAPLDPGARRYSSSQFKTAVRLGLRPPATTYELGAAFGMSRSQTEAEWVQQVMQDESDWLLCSACATEAAPYAS
jgi:HEAT repeat protein